ncbi:hypothetical protein ACIBH1_09185 [Nonomuraea sp. NPDC050663]|uniref:hypothetical protein n=1 Tax=Nonomuraea sp. NPDC050663 TaxID=3364370 RepID=UPI00379BCF9B
MSETLPEALAEAALAGEAETDEATPSTPLTDAALQESALAGAPASYPPSYQAVDAETLRRKLAGAFPRVLGNSNEWSGFTVSLLPVSTPSGSHGFRLEVSPPYSDALHVSYGLREGREKIGTGRRVVDKWEMTVAGVKTIVPVAEVGGELNDWTHDYRSYEIKLAITPRIAGQLRAFEGEHVRDFDHAWQQSIALVAGTAQAIAEATPEDAVAALVDRLIAADARCTIPKHPDWLESWGRHLKDVYTQLCGQSKKRDHTPEFRPAAHSPQAKTWIMRRRRDQQLELLVLYAMGGPGPPSEAVVHAGELSTPFTAADYFEYGFDAVDPSKKFTVGGKVKLRGALPSGVASVYVSPDLSSQEHMAPPDLASVLQAGGLVVSFDHYQVWVKVTLTFFEVTGDWYVYLPGDCLTA